MSASLRALLLAYVSCALAAACGNDPRPGFDLSPDTAVETDTSADTDDAEADAQVGVDVDGPDAPLPDAGPADTGAPDATMPDADLSDADMPDIDLPDEVQPDLGPGCVDECEEAYVECAGDTLLRCALGDEGCFVVVSEDCAALGLLCDEAAAACQRPIEPPCPDAGACDEVGRFCDGDTLVDCARDADGCLEESRAACPLLGLVCVEGAAGGACVEESDPCADGCASETICTDDGALINCALDADGCLRPTFTEDCAAVGQACSVDAEGAARCVDICEGRDTCDPADGGVCDGAVYLSCEADADGCFVTSGVNCAFRRGGFCVPGEGCDVDLCGDGAIDTEIGEACDDLNRTNGDGCSVDCLIEDGFVCAGVPSICTPVECGDDVVAFGEGCEDGNTRSGDGCDADCFLEIPARGGSLSIDQAVRSGGVEWVEPASGCSGTGGFESDFAATWWRNGTGVTQSVVITARGSGGGGSFGPEIFVFEGAWLPGQEPAGCIEASGFPSGSVSEIVDLPVAAGDTIAIIASGGFGFEGNFTLEVSSAGCGDGRVQRELGETCDDGAAEDGDGCSALCTLEDGFACRGEPSECYAFACGDGLVDPDVGEACDDGATEDGDGCDAECALEDGAFCYGEPSVCINPVCGDDVIDLGEGCEDGNLTPGDGCDDLCRVEIPPPGSSRAVEDTFTGSEPLFARPNSSCNITGGSGAYPWRAYSFTNPSATDVVIDVVASWPGDGYLFVYDRYFDPANPTDQCLDGNDDDMGLRSSAIRGLTVEAGQTVVVVGTSWSSGSGILGPFTLTVTTR